MNNEKTGKLISSLRQQKNMTQQDIADKLHITSKAVSKWERGISFPGVDILEPLAKILDISVVDILAGEIIEKPNIGIKAEEVSLQVLKREKSTKTKFLQFFAVILILCLAVVFNSYKEVFFQLGNPIPYIIASTKITEETPYVEVFEKSGVYIAKKGECPLLFNYIEESRKVKFVEQFGSGYLFANKLDSIVVSSQIYLGRFTVWQLPQHTIQAE